MGNQERVYVGTRRRDHSLWVIVVLYSRDVNKTCCIEKLSGTWKVIQERCVRAAGNRGVGGACCQGLGKCRPAGKQSLSICWGSKGRRKQPGCLCFHSLCMWPSLSLLWCSSLLIPGIFLGWIVRVTKDKLAWF